MSELSMLSVLLLTLHVRFSFQFYLDGCPDFCDCYETTIHDATGISTNCSDKAFTAIPKAIPKSSVSLDLSQNVIDDIPRLRLAPFSSLRFLSFSHNKIWDIDIVTFRGMANLRTLLVDHNPVESVGSKSFVDLKELEHLDLSYTKIKKLPKEVWASLEKLRYLNLDGCPIEFLRRHAFYGLKSLESLSLRNAVITTVTTNFFEYVPKLVTLDMSDNPFHCNCYFKDFVRAIKKIERIKLSATCSYPVTLQDRSWDTVNLDELFCKPEIIGCSRKNQLVQLGDKVQIGCRVKTYGAQTVILWSVYGNLSNYDFRYRELEEDKDTIFAYLDIQEAKDENRGLYELYAENPGGSAKAVMSLIVSEFIDNEPVMMPSS